jgi:uncharacterized lipoprotein YbaY
MKTTAFPLSVIALAGALGFFATGCGHLDLTPPGAADRVLTGVVTYSPADPLPPGSEVTVSVIDVSAGEDRGEILGDQTIRNPGPPPIPFRVEYRAEDAVLMRRVKAEARISTGGRLRYATVMEHPVTLQNASEPHTIAVESVGRGRPAD